MASASISVKFEFLCLSSPNEPRLCDFCRIFAPVCVLRTLPSYSTGQGIVDFTTVDRLEGRDSGHRLLMPVCSIGITFSSCHEFE
jgi:hypothetical protein